MLSKILILGGTRFLGSRFLRKLDPKAFDVFVASRRDPGITHYYPIDRKNQNDLVDLIQKNDFQIIVDFISYSMPDAQKLLQAIQSKKNYNPFLVTISSTYVYGNPTKLVNDGIYDETAFNAAAYDYSNLDRPAIDYYEGKKSMEAYLVRHYENQALIRFPIILGANDNTGRTHYFIDLIQKESKISFDKVFGVSNFIFSEEAALVLLSVIQNRVGGPINACFPERLNQSDLLSMYCRYMKKSADALIDSDATKTQTPFYYARDFIINNEKQKKIFAIPTSFESALNRELDLIFSQQPLLK